MAEMVGFEQARLNSRSSRRVPRVLVSSSSAKVSLVRELQKAARRLDPDAHVVAGDVDAGSLSRYVADEFWVMPRTEDAHLEGILEGCRARGINVVLPTRDGELLFWARAREQFVRAGIEVVVSPADSVERCLDKLAFVEWAGARGLPVIPASLTADAVGPGPYVVKERYGAGARSIGIDLDRDAALRHAEGLDSPIFQPYVPGPEISIDTWCDRDHRPRGIVLRRRELVVDGESKVTTTFRDPDLEGMLLQILPAFELRGPIVLQAILDPDEGPRFVECNTRFGGASTVSISAGLDSLFWSLLEAADPSAEVEFHRLRGEVRQVRLQEDRITRLPQDDAT